MWLVRNDIQYVIILTDTFRPNTIGTPKYKFFKYRNFLLQEFIQKDVKTSADFTDQIDFYYKKEPQKMIDFVINREQELKKATEAEELARMKQAEAKKAIEEANKNKSLADSLKNK